MSIDNKVIVSILGGVAEFEYAPRYIECFLVDWDNLNSLYCPLCNVPLKKNICPECLFNFIGNNGRLGDGITAQQVVENYCKVRGIE